MGKCFILNLIFKKYFNGEYSQHLSLQKVLLERGQVIFAVFPTEDSKDQIRKNVFRDCL